MWRTVWRFLRKLKIELPYDPAIPLLGLYLEKTMVRNDHCSAATKTWIQLKCPLTDEWIKKLWYIYTMEYYSALKRNELESVELRWKNLESVIQSEVSQKEKSKYGMLTHIYGM